MIKYIWLYLFSLNLFFSCSESKIESQENESQLSLEESELINVYNKMVFRIDLPMDSVDYYYKKIEKLNTENKEISSFKELIKATYFRKKGSFRLAISHYENSLEHINKNEIHADYAFVGLGISNKHLGDFPKALFWFQKSVENCERRKDTIRLSGAYASLAQLSFEKNDIQQAEQYANSVFELLKNNKTERPYLIALHTLANIKLKTGDFEKAMKLDREGIILAEEMKNDAVKITFQDNLARCYLDHLKDYNKALYFFNENLIIDKKLNNPNWIADTYVNLAEVETQKKNYTSAQLHLKNAIEISEKTNQLNNSLKAYNALKELYEKQGNHVKALEASEIYLQLYKKYFNEKSEQSFVEYNTLFETKKKENKLAETQIKLSEKEIESKNKNMWIIGLSGLTLITMFLIRNLKIKSNLKQKKLQLEISRELHDSLGAQLTFINSLSESVKKSNATKNDEDLKDHISKLSDYSSNAINELKNTIWVLNTKDLSLNELKMKMLNFVSQASESEENIRFHFDFEINKEIQLNSKQSINIFRVFQEIVNNAIKYSQAKNVDIKIEQKTTSLNINIFDDGIGFDYEIQKSKSYGLTNIENRILEIDGNLHLETSPSQGTRYKIIVKI